MYIIVKSPNTWIKNRIDGNCLNSKFLMILTVSRMEQNAVHGIVMNNVNAKTLVSLLELSGYIVSTTNVNNNTTHGTADNGRISLSRLDFGVFSINSIICCYGIDLDSSLARMPQQRCAEHHECRSFYLNTVSMLFQTLL